jgi:hypothetical protein
VLEKIGVTGSEHEMKKREGKEEEEEERYRIGIEKRQGSHNRGHDESQSTKTMRHEAMRPGTV